MTLAECHRGVRQFKIKVVLVESDPIELSFCWIVKSMDYISATFGLAMRSSKKVL